MPNVQRDNLRAGIFVLVGLVLALAVAFTIADPKALFRQTQTVLVDYQLADGLQGLKPGAQVTLGDVPVGSVETITPVVSDDGRVVGQRVELSLPAEYQIRADAAFEIKTALFGSGTRLNIRSVGQGPAYQPGTALTGEFAANPLVKQALSEAGIRERQVEQIGEIIGNLERFTAALASSSTTQPNLTQVELVIRDMQVTAATLREEVPKLLTSGRGAFDQAQPIADDVRTAARELNTAIAKVNKLLDEYRARGETWSGRIDSISKSLDETASTVRALIKDADPKVRETVDNLHAVSTTAKENALPRMLETLAQAQKSMDNVQAATSDLRALLTTQRPVLERTLANAQLASDQLKLATIEVRRSPWRLLYNPPDKELETDNLYDAARSFALAASTLDTTAQSLKALAENPNADPRQVQQMTEHLERTFGKYRDAESAFWDELKKRK